MHSNQHWIGSWCKIRKVVVSKAEMAMPRQDGLGLTFRLCLSRGPWKIMSDYID